MTERSDGRRLLLVEDDARYREALAGGLRDHGFVVVEAGSVAAALVACEDATFDFTVLDLRLGEGSGLEVLRALAPAERGIRAVVLSGWGSIAAALEATRLGAVDFVSKPITLARLVAALEGQENPTASLGAAAEPMATPSLDRVEWEHIQRVLLEVDGNVSQAARQLGLHRRSLQRKLRKRPPQR